MNKIFNFIFLGTTHGFVDDFKKQEELISKFSPEIILSEDMENKSLVTQGEYNIFLEQQQHSNMTSFDDVKHLVALCKNKSIKLIGIDLENFGFNTALIQKINNNQVTKQDEEKIDSILKKREQYQIKKIQDYTSDRVILVFLGSWHLRKNSPLCRNIENAKIIFPANKDGDLITEPTGESIMYAERVLQ